MTKDNLLSIHRLVSKMKSYFFLYWDAIAQQHFLLVQTRLRNYSRFAVQIKKSPQGDICRNISVSLEDDESHSVMLSM